MNGNARRRLESVQKSKAQAARDAAYQAQCDGLTPQQRCDRARAILADVTATLSLAGVRRVY